jgi:hypothetical protein
MKITDVNVDLMFPDTGIRKSIKEKVSNYKGKKFINFKPMA